MVKEIISSNFIILTIAAFFLGLDKGGFRNLSVICMYLLLTIFPSKQVIGILAPIYLIGDIIPIYLYRKYINYKAVKAFTPLALVGLLITIFFASFFDDRLFTIFISFFLLLMVIIISYQEITKYVNKKKNIKVEEKVLSKPATLLLSFVSGISTVSNAAGAMTCIYFFKQTKDKKEFVGSTGIFFFFLNFVKIIVFALFWKNINTQTLTITASMLFGLFLGIGSSIFLLKVIPQKIFNIIVILSVYYITIMLFVKNIF